MSDGPSDVPPGGMPAGAVTDYAQLFNVEFDRAIALEVASTGSAVAEWQKAGTAKPETQIENWRTLGPQCVQRFIDWYEASDYSVWVTPDGKPAIELDLLPTFGRIPVRVIIDTVLVGPLGLLVLDLKSGSKRPESLHQLGLYACAIELIYGIRPLYGSYFMAKGAGRNQDIFLTEPVPLLEWGLSVDYFTQQFEALERSIAVAQDGDHYLANVGKACDRCDVARGCAAVGGDLAPEYDTTGPR